MRVKVFITTKLVTHRRRAHRVVTAAQLPVTKVQGGSVHTRRVIREAIILRSVRVSVSRKRREPPRALQRFPRFLFRLLVGGPRVPKTLPTSRLTLKPAWHTRLVMTKTIVTVRRRRVTLANYRDLARGRNLFRKARTVEFVLAVALKIRSEALGPRVHMF